MNIEIRKRRDGYHLIMGEENLGCIFDETHAVIVKAFLKSILDSGQIVPSEGGTVNDKARTSYENEINRKLNVLKDALLATMHVAWMSTGDRDLRGRIDESRVALQEAWQEEEEVQRGPV